MKINDSMAHITCVIADDALWEHDTISVVAGGGAECKDDREAVRLCFSEPSSRAKGAHNCPWTSALNNVQLLICIV